MILVLIYTNRCGQTLLFAVETMILNINQLQTRIIGVAPITQYVHVRNKNSNTQGSSPNVVKVISNTTRNCS